MKVPGRRLAAALGRWAMIIVALWLCLLGAVACSSIEVVRISPGLLKLPPRTEPLAALQVSCVGFYIFTLGIPDCDIQRVVNEILLPKAREIGADRLLQLRFSGTPESGIWWLTKLLWFRTARVTAIAVVATERPQKTPPATRPSAAAAPTSSSSFSGSSSSSRPAPARRPR